MSLISFEAREKTCRLGDPRQNFRPTEFAIEFRKDPLSGRSARLAHFGAINSQPLDLESYRRPEIIGFCPFCGENRFRLTPTFAQDLFAEGRLKRGRALLVPNLFPYDRHSSVCILSEDHVLALGELDSELVSNALLLGREYWHRLGARAGIEEIFPLMGWNYMPPSGGGLVHPHQQFFFSEDPGNYCRESFRASEDFRRQHGVDYWSSLLAAEEEIGERFLGRTGMWSWISAFAPEGILGEIRGILPGAWNLDSLDDEAIRGLVAGLQSCFRYFISAEIFSFNASLFVGPVGQSHFAAHIRLIPRTFLNLRDMAPDVNFLQFLFDEPVCVLRPEELTGQAKGSFSPAESSQP